MVEQKTLYDKLMARIKNNPIVAVLILLCTFTIAIATFTNATQRLVDLFRQLTQPARVDVTGRWKTDLLTDQYFPNLKYWLVFEFRCKDGVLLGEMKWLESGGGEGRYPIRRGKIEGNKITFAIPIVSYKGKEETHFNDYYKGVVSGDKIEFLAESDRPWSYQPEEFVAQKEK